MKPFRRMLAHLLAIATVMQFAPSVKACGPESLEPIFVSRTSPDLPFNEFAQGKIGILKPTFGRKTLTIAYRYLNGAVFTGEEQKELVKALSGSASEDDQAVATKAWIAARKAVLQEEAQPLAIYRESANDNYDFFPNCTSNAFEVATETLKDRVGRFGSDDANVREWLAGQDIVFQNCAEGSVSPKAIGADRPVWLQKDRDYQIAASRFYSLHLDEARAKFEEIANDTESDWQQTADYLVARTLVRQASLEAKEDAKRTRYETAETYLTNLLGRSTKFRRGANKLMALVKYRLRPELRVTELAQILTEQSGNENVRQDLIDYGWLLDKFDEQVRRAEEERQKAVAANSSETHSAELQQTLRLRNEEQEKIEEAVWRGEIIQIWFFPRTPNGQVDTSGVGGRFVFQPDVTESQIVQTVEGNFGRKLRPDESKALSDAHTQALESRRYWLSPNRKFNTGVEYDGCGYQCSEIRLEQLPSFLKSQPLTDWIFTFQLNDPQAYSHAVEQWRETQSHAWLAIALAKADKSSPSLKRLLANAEQIQPDTAVFATAVYHRIRLYMDMTKREEARRLLDDVIDNHFELLPVSAQNQFAELRMQLAVGLTDFLKFSTRKPIAFYKYGLFESIADLLKSDKANGEEFDPAAEEHFQDLLQWDGRAVFDATTVETLNWHLPLAQLVEATHDPALPDYIRQQLLLTVWTRAVLLKRHEVARKTAGEIIEKGVATPSLFRIYLQAATPAQVDDAATFILLKLNQLSPYIGYGIPETRTNEELDYYFEISWWCPLSETDYDSEGKEIPKRVTAPGFLDSESLAAAKNERAALIAIGDGKKFLGQRVVDWAKRKPKDPRLPEALFIATRATERYKYGCGGWDADEDLHIELEGMLRERYAGSSWTAKLDERDQ